MTNPPIHDVDRPATDRSVAKTANQVRLNGIQKKNTARRYITITNSNASAFNSTERVLPAQPNKKFSIKFERKIVAKISNYPDSTTLGYTKGRTNRHYPLTDSLELTRTATLPEMASLVRSPLCRSLTRYPTQIDFFNLSKDVEERLKGADKTLKPLRDPFVTPDLRKDDSSDDSKDKALTVENQDFICNNKIKLRNKTPIKRVYSEKHPRENISRYKNYQKPPLPKIFVGNNPCLFKLYGPILLSAPHGIKLWRGGTDGRKRRIHYREMWITELVLKLSMYINKYTGVPSSFVIWDRRVAIPADTKNLDPNYLTEGQFSESPWHESLVQFKRFGELNNCPIMHIDVHGKKDRKTNMDVDFGFRALENRWHDKGFVGWIKSEVNDSFGRLFEQPYCESNDMKYMCNVNPSLCGDWGGDLYTMTSQSVCMGIPAFQLEIPKTIRTHLIENDIFLSKFAKCIVDVYRKCILQNTDESEYKENRICRDFIDKVYNEHVKIQRAAREKQI